MARVSAGPVKAALDQVSVEVTLMLDKVGRAPAGRMDDRRCHRLCQSFVQAFASTAGLILSMRITSAGLGA